jgi:hypothetical protein
VRGSAGRLRQRGQHGQPGPVSQFDSVRDAGRGSGQGLGHHRGDAPAAGEQTATIEGTWFGTPVDATFSQLSGCAAVRWQELGQVLNPVR